MMKYCCGCLKWIAKWQNLRFAHIALFLITNMQFLLFLLLLLLLFIIIVSIMLGDFYFIYLSILFWIFLRKYKQISNLFILFHPPPKKKQSFFYKPTDPLSTGSQSVSDAIC